MDAGTEVLRFLWKKCIYDPSSSTDSLTEADSKDVSSFPTAPEPKRRRSFTPPTVDTGEAKPVEQTPAQPAPKAQEPVEDFSFEQPTPPTPVVETPVEQPVPQAPPTPEPPPVAPTQPAVKYHPTAKVEKTTNPVGPTSVTPLKRRKTQKVIVFSVMGAVLFGLVANTVVGVVNRPADAETIAAQVSAGVASDGYYAPFVAAGEQFLTAYLQSAIQGEDATRSQVIEEMTAGEGNAWVSSIEAPRKKDDPEPFVQEIVHGPVLLDAPRASKSAPSTVSLMYEAWLTTPTGALEQIQLAVPVRLDDRARGVVMAAPTIMPLVQRTLPQVEVTTTGVDVSAETRAQAELFLQAWSQASPGEDDNDAALNAVIAPEATFYTREGLSGQVDFLAMDSISMFAPANEDGTIQPTATGTVIVSWGSSGEVKKSEYLLVMERVGDKWLVKQIGSY